VRLTERIDRTQQRRTVLGLPLGVIYKNAYDGGGQLAALITYYGFLSLFPLLLLATTILGWVLNGHPELQQRVLDSALTQLPVIGDELGRPDAIGGGAAGVVIGVLGAAYGGIGVAQAVQNASNTAWTVARNQRPNPLLGRLRSLLLLLVIAGDVVGPTVVVALARTASGLGPAASVLVLVGSFLVHAAAFATVFRLSTSRELTWRPVLPGAVVAAIAWLVLQQIGVAYVGGVVADSGSSNGVFAVVLGLLAFLYLTSNAVVLSLELNVVLVERLYPRSLLTPFTDNVTLTRADRRSYRGMAKAQTLKGFQKVEVTFDQGPTNQTAEGDAPGHDHVSPPGRGVDG
jgi:uncharacterized BrkB/YihY/UPF0761 family membrane protein